MYNTQLLQKLLIQHDLEAVIATTKENIFYFTGFDPVTKTLNPYHGQCYAIITRKEPELVHLVIFLGEVDQVLDANVLIGNVETFGCFYRKHNTSAALTDMESKLLGYLDLNCNSKLPITALQKLLVKLNLNKSRVGIDEDGLSITQREQIQHQININLIHASAILRQVRAIKTPEEAHLIAQSARCNENAIQFVVNHLYEGISEQEIVKIFETALIEQDARPALTMIKIGRHAVGGQMRPSHEVKLQPGDLIWFDSDAIYKGYWSDIARVFVYQEHKPAYQKYAALLRGQQHAISEIRPGMSGSEVFTLTMQAVHDAGFTDYRRHHVGHGIGLEPYEKPLLSPDSTDLIEEGMIISVETPYYEFGVGALHVEDPILITKSGNQRLTLTNRELEVIE